jgi:uncharacterized membrane protein YtjA (UPF0391 family)
LPSGVKTASAALRNGASGAVPWRQSFRRELCGAFACLFLGEESAQRKETAMLYYAAVFFIIALIAALFGFTGIAAGAAGIAKILFMVFVVLFLVSLVMGLLKRGP